MPSKTAIVVGAGIVGLAMARSLALKGYSVKVFERSSRAVGASIRNFGMIWPIGQPAGSLYERALRSKSIWQQLCTDARCWYDAVGSMHVAANALEQQVLEEFFTANGGMRPLQLLSPQAALNKCAAINTANCTAALYSDDEMIVEARDIIGQLPAYLHEKHGVAFYFDTAVTAIHHPNVTAGGTTWQADVVYVCSGADFSTLYADLYAQQAITQCKLQMMRMIAQPGNWRIGAALCGGLSLIHYKSFECAPSLASLRQHVEQTMPHYTRWGIHVMASQNAAGELTIGDSHEYGPVHDPFDKAFINQLILDYLQQFALFKSHEVVQSWHGIYAKNTNSNTELILHPEPGVTIVNGLGGAGMTLSFGLADEVVGKL